RSISTYKGRSSFSTWIFGIAHHTTCRHFRRQTPKTYSLENDSPLGVEIEKPSEERRLDAIRALEHCTDTLARSRNSEHLEIFRLFYADNQSVKKIAEATGKPVDSIKDSLRRSRNLLIRDLPDLKSILNPAMSA
ncbi:sigma-70 family RNA polymerase sigma factor, partial [Myxococcota bacterium]|nr:sigma-70 family RNA polymerase sigma factor [Myxococcota bacterium]